SFGGRRRISLRSGGNKTLTRPPDFTGDWQGTTLIASRRHVRRCKKAKLRRLVVQASPHPHGKLKGRRDLVDDGRSSMIENDFPALLHAGAEGDDGVIAPDLGDDRLAGKDGGGEAALETSKPLRLVVADRAQERMARDSEGAEAVQDRAGKAAFRR